jgi:hypothetical protein
MTRQGLFGCETAQVATFLVWRQEARGLAPTIPSIVCEVACVCQAPRLWGQGHSKFTQG